MHLFQVTFLISLLLYSFYDSTWLSLYLKVLFGYFILKVIYLNRNKYNTTRRMIQIVTWGDHATPLARGVVKINVTKAIRHINSLAISGRAVTLTDLLVKAIARAVDETEELRGHLALGMFYPSKAANVSVLMTNSFVEGDSTILLKTPSKRSVNEIAEERENKTKARNVGNASQTQGFPNFFRFLPSSILSLIISLQEFSLSLRIALGKGEDEPHAFLTDIGYIGEMFGFQTPPPLFRGPLTLSASTVTDDIVIDENEMPAVAQVLKLGVACDFRYVLNPKSMKFLERIRDEIESLKVLSSD